MSEYKMLEVDKEVRCPFCHRVFRVPLHIFGIERLHYLQTLLQEKANERKKLEASIDAITKLMEQTG